MSQIDQERWERCRIPSETTFQTKPELALELFQPLWESQQFGGNWVACDCTFGNNDPFLAALPKELFYLAEIACTRKVWVKKARRKPKLETEGCTVQELLDVKGLLNWQTHKISEGAKGPIVAAFARIRVYTSAERSPESERWLLLRNDANQELKYTFSNAPQETSMKELVRVSGARWPIECCFEEGKSELGMDHYEHRSWPAWHRHMRLVFLAQLFLIRLQIQYQEKAPALTLPQARLLLEGSFPRLKEEPSYRRHLRSVLPRAHRSGLPFPLGTNHESAPQMEIPQGVEKKIEVETVLSPSILSSFSDHPNSVESRLSTHANTLSSLIISRNVAVVLVFVGPASRAASSS